MNSRIRGGGIVVALFAVLYSIFQSTPYDLSIGVDIGVVAIGVLGVTAAVGGAGQLNLGQGGFMTIGGYSVAYLTTNLKVPFLLGLFVGVVAAVLAGILVGYIALRLHGNYLAMATLAAGWIIYSLVLANTALGGSEGFANIPLPSIGGWVLSSPIQQYWMVWIVVLLSYGAAWLLFQTHVGRELQAIRDDEVAAKCVGINVTLRKVQIFAFCALLGSLAGGIDASIQSAIDPNLFGPTESFQLFVLAVIGGLGSLVGSVVAASIVIWLTQVIPSTGNYAILALGAIAVFVMATLPTGIGGLGSRIFDYLYLKFFHRWSGPPAGKSDEEQGFPVNSDTLGLDSRESPGGLS